MTNGYYTKVFWTNDIYTTILYNIQRLLWRLPTISNTTILYNDFYSPLLFPGRKVHIGLLGGLNILLLCVCADLPSGGPPGRGSDGDHRGEDMTDDRWSMTDDWTRGKLTTRCRYDPGQPRELIIPTTPILGRFLFW